MRVLLNRSSVVSRTAFALALACGATTAAAAQQSQRGPYAGLFGASADDRTQSVDLRGALFGAVDDSILANLGLNPNDPLLLDPRLQKSGLARGFNTTLSYRLSSQGEHRQVAMSAESVLSESTTFLSGTTTPALWGSVSKGRAHINTDVTSKTTIGFGAGAAYSPFYQNKPFLKEGNEASRTSNRVGLAIASDWVSGGDASASITNKRSRRTTLGANVGWRKAQDGNLQSAAFVDPSALDRDLRDLPLPALTAHWVSTSDATASIMNSFSSRSSVSGDIGWHLADQTENQSGRWESRTATVGLTHKLAEKLSVHGKFGMQQRRYSLDDNSPWTIYPVMDFGLGYGDGVALTRRLRLSVATDMAVVRSGELSVVSADEPRKTTFRVGGSGILTRRIGRTWQTSIGYDRGTSYIAGFTDPIFYDATEADLDGQLGSRLRFSVGATYSHGQLAFGTSDEVIVRRIASGRLTYGLAQHLGLYGQYTYHNFNVPSIFLASDLPPTLRRRSVSFGLSYWQPLFASGKGSRDTE